MKMAALSRILIILIVSFGFCITSYASDWRDIENGWEIPTEFYADQPYIVKTNDGAWLCIMTTGAGHEGQSGQHVITMRSTDRGKTWAPPVDVEPAQGPEASYAVLLKVPYGRIYAFYNHNTDNLRQVKADNPPYKDGYCQRVDSLGYFVFKYSDDNGNSWSKQRYAIPVREMEIDRQNPYQGAVRFFWNVGKAFSHVGSGFVPLHKVGGFGRNFFTRNEGVLLRSPNILIERDPQKIEWETLPEGDIGLRTPPGGGPISAEQSFSILSDGSFYCVYRSVDGHSVFTYSRDQGRSWDTPQYKRYADGSLMKHPRAANFAWKCSNGKYLYWFHNHGGRSYDDRNPVWLCGGVENDSPQGRIIQWSQPEIILYDDDPAVRMSYPDLVEEDGQYFLTETQKTIARVHQIDPELLNALWRQFDERRIITDGLILDLPNQTAIIPGETQAPELPNLISQNTKRPEPDTFPINNGFSIVFWVRFNSLKPGMIIASNQTDAGQGFCLQTTNRQTIELVLNDGRTENSWDCDPGLLKQNKLHHIAVIIDGGPKIITFIIDGKLCDGASSRQFGWGRFNPNLRSAHGGDMLRLSSNFDGNIKKFRIYNRRLLTSEAISNYRAGL